MGQKSNIAKAIAQMEKMTAKLPTTVATAVKNTLKPSGTNVNVPNIPPTGTVITVSAVALGINASAAAAGRPDPPHHGPPYWRIPSTERISSTSLDLGPRS